MLSRRLRRLRRRVPASTGHDTASAGRRHDASDGDLRDVVLVGNNWSGTVTAFDPLTFETLAIVDVVPDWNARIDEIKKDAVRSAAFKLIRKVAGEGTISSSTMSSCRATADICSPPVRALPT